MSDASRRAAVLAVHMTPAMGRSWASHALLGQAIRDLLAELPRRREMPVFPMERDAVERLAEIEELCDMRAILRG